MLLHSIYRILNDHGVDPKSAATGKDTAPSGSVGGDKDFSKMVDKASIPVSKATIEAAARARGVKKIELEIAAAAGLLRPISPELPPESNPSPNSFEELLRTIEELKKPHKSPGLDLFE